MDVLLVTLSCLSAIKENPTGERQKGPYCQGHDCCLCSIVCGAMNIPVMICLMLKTFPQLHLTLIDSLAIRGVKEIVVISSRSLTAHPSTAPLMDDLLFVAKPCWMALKSNSRGEKQKGAIMAGVTADVLIPTVHVAVNI